MRDGCSVSVAHQTSVSMYQSDVSEASRMYQKHQEGISILYQSDVYCIVPLVTTSINQSDVPEASMLVPLVGSIILMYQSDQGGVIMWLSCFHNQPEGGGQILNM